MVTTIDVGKAFWKGSKAKGSSVESTGDKLFSYSTVILQRLSDGHVIANGTKYSVTTSKHQSQVRIDDAYLKLHDIPRGTTDLIEYIKRFNIMEWAEIQGKTITEEERNFIEKFISIKEECLK